MRLVKFCCVILLVCCCFVQNCCSNELSNSTTDVSEMFKQYVEKYNKPYVKGSEEYSRRQSIFKKSVERIMSLNQLRGDKNSAWYGITQFSDMTPEEFNNEVVRRSLQKAKNPKPSEWSPRKYLNEIHDIPKKVDWREKNVVTPVMSQDKCGACWAFSTIETVESMNALKTGKLINLSVQQVIDCAEGENQGCDGGDTCGALKWMAKNHVYIQTAESYPYQDGVGVCKFPKPTSGVQISQTYTCDNFVDKEEEMLRLLAHHGPLVAAVDAASWQDYLGGIIQYHCENNRNHAVQIVGYDLTGDIPYYIVRNTWGTAFGINGYLHIAVGKNLCAIAEEVSRVDVL